jgi:hypothetical protein
MGVAALAGEVGQLVAGVEDVGVRPVQQRAGAGDDEEDAAVELGTLTDGTILTSSADSAPYLFQDGRRKRILSPAGVLAAGVDLHTSAAQQLTVSEKQLQRIPSAGLLAPAGTRQFDSWLIHLGANDWMHTWGPGTWYRPGIGPDRHGHLHLVRRLPRRHVRHLQ